MQYNTIQHIMKLSIQYVTCLHAHYILHVGMRCDHLVLVLLGKLEIKILIEFKIRSLIVFHNAWSSKSNILCIRFVVYL